MNDDQGRYQRGGLAEFEQVRLLLRAPSELPLDFEKGLEDEVATGTKGIQHPSHPRPVEIVEEEDDVELAHVGPGGLEIGFDPADGQPASARVLASLAEFGGVLVHRHDIGPELSSRDGMPSGPAGKIENPNARTDQAGVRGKPIAGPLLETQRRNRCIDGQSMNPSARATIWDLTARRLDVLVIGGGITGAGIAREAAMRGLSVAVVDRGDFGSGTSSRSSRLIHGGLRYLEHRQWSLVRESLVERSVLLRIAPHLVRPLSFLFPVFATDRLSRWKIELGLTLYDVLALRGNVRRHRALSKRAVLEEEPLLRERGLAGGALYWDAQCDDARLTLAALRSAAAHGALVSNYMCVTALEMEDGRISGATIEDRLTGAQGTVHARVVVNAAGPWVDQIRRLEDPAEVPLLAPTRGAHVMVPRSRLGHQHAITFLSPIDGRVMFVLPWGDRSYIGTTDTDSGDSPDHVAATEADMLYLLRSANAIFPNARLALEDVSVSWAGLRPLLRDAKGSGPGARSREHSVTTGRRGLITVAGGKLTTFRRMAFTAIDQVQISLGVKPIPQDPSKSRSATEPLPGGDAYRVETLFARGSGRGLSERTVAHLVGQYGSEVPTLYEFIAEWPELREPVHPRHGAIGAQVVHAVRREYARKIDDVMIRRLSLAYETPDAGLAALDGVSRLMSRELGWDETRRREEIERYRELASAIPRGRTLLSGADPDS